MCLCAWEYYSRSIFQLPRLLSDRTGLSFLSKLEEWLLTVLIAGSSRSVTVELRPRCSGPPRDIRKYSSMRTLVIHEQIRLALACQPRISSFRDGKASSKKG